MPAPRLERTYGTAAKVTQSLIEDLRVHVIAGARLSRDQRASFMRLSKAEQLSFTRPPVVCGSTANARPSFPRGQVLGVDLMRASSRGLGDGITIAPGLSAPASAAQ
jgi:hypothetical protein